MDTAFEQVKAKVKQQLLGPLVWPKAPSVDF